VSALQADGVIGAGLEGFVTQVRPVAVHHLGKIAASQVRKLVHGHVERLLAGLVQFVVRLDELDVGLKHGELGCMLGALVRLGELQHAHIACPCVPRASVCVAPVLLAAPNPRPRCCHFSSSTPLGSNAFA
jgi:hypothetical protein